VSGLNLGSSWSDQLSVEMLVDYITGQLGGVRVRPRPLVASCDVFVCDMQDQEFCSAITRVIIAGDSITDKPVKSSITAKNTRVCW
jgi:hypothetical protein